MRLSGSTLLGLELILLACSVMGGRAEKPFDPPGKYYTSWLGNTY
jgi:hypothetical protein